MQSPPRRKKRLIVTLQLKNAEVYPGSNLHGTVILQLMHKHHRHHHDHRHHHQQRDRAHSIESVDTPSASADVKPLHFPDAKMVVMESVSVSVVGLCKMKADSEQSHFPMHLRDEGPSFNILRGNENVLARGLQLRDDEGSDSVQFDFVVQLPPILPCSYSGHFVEYEYFARLLVSISSTAESAPTAGRCRVPLYVLPLRTASNLVIPRLMTPKNLQERLSVFRKRGKMEERHCWTTPSTPSLQYETAAMLPADG